MMRNSIRCSVNLRQEWNLLAMMGTMGGFWRLVDTWNDDYYGFFLY